MPPFPRLSTLLLLLTAACGPASAEKPRAAASDSTPPPPSAPIVGSEWVLVSLGGAAPIAGSRITMKVSETHVGGYDGCNWYGAEHGLRGDSLAVAPIESNARGCTRPAGVMEQEERYHRLLRSAATYRVAGDTLRLVDASGAELLTYARRRRLAMNPADLVGTRWRLESWSGHPPITTPRITLAFDAQTMRGFAGCRDYTGAYRAQGDEIGFPEMAMLSMECADRDLLLQEGTFTTALSESSNYRLGGGRLELYTVGGDTLVFRAAR